MKINEKYFNFKGKNIIIFIGALMYVTLFLHKIFFRDLKLLMQLLSYNKLKLLNIFPNPV